MLTIRNRPTKKGIYFCQIPVEKRVHHLHLKQVIESSNVPLADPDGSFQIFSLKMKNDKGIVNITGPGVDMNALGQSYFNADAQMASDSGIIPFNELTIGYDKDGWAAGIYFFLRLEEDMPTPAGLDKAQIISHVDLKTMKVQPETDAAGRSATVPNDQQQILDTPLTEIPVAALSSNPASLQGRSSIDYGYGYGYDFHEYSNLGLLPLAGAMWALMKLFLVLASIVWLFGWDKATAAFSYIYDKVIKPAAKAALDLAGKVAKKAAHLLLPMIQKKLKEWSWWLITRPAVQIAGLAVGGWAIFKIANYLGSRGEGKKALDGRSR